MSRPRSNSMDSIMPRSSSTAPARPLTLFFYCPLADYTDIMRDGAIWESQGIPAAIPMPNEARARAAAAAAAGLAAPPAHVGAFPVGAYAASSPPEVVKRAHQDFLQQWYGGWRPATPVDHYIEFEITNNWQLQGHNRMARANSAPFSWHWVNSNIDTTIQRGPVGPGNPPRRAVRITMVRHGRFIP